MSAPEGDHEPQGLTVNRPRTALAGLLVGVAVLATGCGPVRASGQAPAPAGLSTAVPAPATTSADASRVGPTGTAGVAAATPGTVSATPGTAAGSAGASAALSGEISQLSSLAAQASAAAAGVDSELSQSTPSPEGTVP